jgi:hypothetical protein
MKGEINFAYLFACVNKGGRYTEMLDTFQHYAVVVGVERSLVVRVHYVYDFDVGF